MVFMVLFSSILLFLRFTSLKIIEYLGETEISKSSGENSSLNLAVAHKEHQERLLACLTTLSLFSKVRASLMVKHAETLQPYLSINLTGSVEQRVMNQVLPNFKLLWFSSFVFSVVLNFHIMVIIGDHFTFIAYTFFR